LTFKNISKKVTGGTKTDIYFIASISSYQKLIKVPTFSVETSVDQATRDSVQEWIKVVEAYFATKSLFQTQRQFRRTFPGRNSPTRFTIKRSLDKSSETGSVATHHCISPPKQKSAFGFILVHSLLEVSGMLWHNILKQRTFVLWRSMVTGSLGKAGCGK